MGGTSYISASRSARSQSLGYDTVTGASANTVFLQNKERQAHKDMLPANIKKVREARDSDVHPNSIPVQLYLDVTGSMGEIPPMLVREGLPTIMETMLGKGINDVSLMFGAIGDHEADRFPLQVGQFESGDAELDMWLTRTYMEGGGGGNAGESYGLAWFMANNFVETKEEQKTIEGVTPWIVDLVNASVTSPDKFKSDGSIWVYNKTEIWVANGVKYTDIFNNPVIKLTELEKTTLYNAFVNWNKRYSEEAKLNYKID